MKSLMLLWQVVANEYGDRCRVSTTRDYETLTRRVEDEGLSFLTITLPDFGKSLEKGLDWGWVDHTHFAGFAKCGGTPQFLGGFLDLIFERESGRLLEEPCIEAIAAVRQLTLMFGKIRLECTEKRNVRAFRNYLECEKEVRYYDQTLSVKAPGKLGAFGRMSRLLFGDVFDRVNTDVATLQIVPKHGPGATADRLSGNRKYGQTEWTTRLESAFPSVDYLIPSPRYWSELEEVDFLEPGAERPVRVITVPKTLKTPRIIAIEPTAMQYAQQGLMEKFVDYLEDDKIVGQMIGFTDQTPNQRLAQVGSLTGALSTLDLSEASDRVSNQLVREMLRPYPDLFDAVDACRSRSADVPGFGVVRLAKFASMGSALCFPMEAMVFLTIIFLGIEQELNRPLTRKLIREYAGKVRVYGDDIIIPVEYTRAVTEGLALFGHKVNSGKSFWTGKFRESCGKEYYDGHDVSIVRVRDLFPTSTADAAGCESLVSLRNQFYLNGSWATARYLDSICKKVLRYFPTVSPDSPVLGRVSLLGFETQRLHKHLHSPQVKGYRVVARPPKDPLDGYAALLKWFLKRGSEPFANKDHLERYGRPRAVRIKLGWGPSA